MPLFGLDMHGQTNLEIMLLVVVTGDDKEQVSKSAEYLAQSFWDVRNEFDFVAPTTTFEKRIRIGS